MREFRTLVSWVLALALIAAFLHLTVHPLPDPTLGRVQLFDPPGENVLFATLAEKSRYPIFEPAGRVAAALFQLLAGFLLFFPWTRRFGAVLAFLFLASLVGLHLSPWLGRELPLGLAPGEAATDGGMAFSLSVAMMVASVLVMMVHPRRQH